MVDEATYVGNIDVGYQNIEEEEENDPDLRVPQQHSEGSISY